MVFHCRVRTNRDLCFNLSHLCYAVSTYTQYQATVKLLGSFRLAAGRGHLHPHCIFTELFPETVVQSLRHSCASELTRQGISLFDPLTKYSIFTPLMQGHGVWYLRILDMLIFSCGSFVQQVLQFALRHFRTNALAETSS